MFYLKKKFVGYQYNQTFFKGVEYVFTSVQFKRERHEYLPEVDSASVSVRNKMSR